MSTGTVPTQKAVMRTVSIFLTTIFLASITNAQTFPLIGGYWSTNCENPDEIINVYTKSPTADYASIQFKSKREVMKANGYAKFNQQDGIWTIQDNAILPDKRTLVRELTIKMATDDRSFALIKSIINGTAYVNNGIDTNTGQPSPPRRRCPGSSAVVQANIPSNEEWKASSSNLPLPSPPHKSSFSSNKPIEPNAQIMTYCAVSNTGLFPPVGCGLSLEQCQQVVQGLTGMVCR